MWYVTTAPYLEEHRGKTLLPQCHQSVLAILKLKVFVFMSWNKQQQHLKERICVFCYLNISFINSLWFILPLLLKYIILSILLSCKCLEKEELTHHGKKLWVEGIYFYESGSKTLSLLLKLLSQPYCASKSSHLAEYMISKMNIC